MSSTQTTTLPGYVAGTWTIDPVHSEVGFTVRHMMVSKVRGKFSAFSGQFVTGTDPQVVRRHFRSSMSIGVIGFLAPYLGVLVYARYLLDWPWPQAQIAGISLSTTSVAVVYAVMVETGFNRTEIGKIILAACFVNDLGTVLALGIVFAHYDLWLAMFGAVTAVALWLLPRFRSMPTVVLSLSRSIALNLSIASLPPQPLPR